ncbi:MAG: acyltransferase [Gemmatimonadetes bacterium]|nr:acyltransferase [Gemmatimonadota bacterium]
MTSLWTQAAGAAARTPDTRNRYVDFLRAVSILAVISGHWLMAAPWVSGGGVRLSNLLEYRSWTHFLTWVFQVMPVFFLVGGYSNGVSWKAAVRDGKSYADWLNGRLQRLLGPVMPLLVVWVVLGAAGTAAHVEPVLLRAGSQMALVPIWFLAVYTMAVVLVPFTYAAWHRFGMWSFWALALAAVLDDVLFFGADLRLLGWLNYGFVWLAVHQLGYAWREGWFAGTRRTLVWAATGLLTLVALVTIGPYPVSMVSVPGEDVSNTLPPKLPMLLIGVVQSGLLISIEAPMRRWLRRITPWTATVLVNGMIMTIFLWHLTASTLLIGGAMVAGDIGLTAVPGSPTWWLLRPVWLAAYLVALAGLAMIFGRFERDRPGIPPAAPWRQVLGAVFVCGGLAFLALDGVAGSGALGIRPVALLPFVGAALASVTPFGRTAVGTAA